MKKIPQAVFARAEIVALGQALGLKPIGKWTNEKIVQKTEQIANIIGDLDALEFEGVDDEFEEESLLDTATRFIDAVTSSMSIQIVDDEESDEEESEDEESDEEESEDEESEDEESDEEESEDEESDEEESEDEESEDESPRKTRQRGKSKTESKPETPFNFESIEWKDAKGKLFDSIDVRKVVIDADLAAMMLKHCNKHNRPLSMSIAKRYAYSMLNGYWTFNGEPIIIDDSHNIVNGQHRLRAIVEAEKQRNKDPQYYKTLGVTGPIRIPVVLIVGVRGKAANSLDQGKTRSGSDAILVDQGILPRTMDAKTQRKVARVLQTASKLVWTRTTGSTYESAPAFMLSEQVAFCKAHPHLVEACQYMVELNEDTEGGLRQRVNPAVAAGIYYLAWMAEAGDDPTPETLSEACDATYVFFEELVHGGAKDAPSTVCGEILVRNSKANDGKLKRDYIVNLICKAYLAWMAEESASLKTMKLTKAEQERGHFVRIGGIDCDVDSSEYEEEVPEEMGDEDE